MPWLKRAAALTGAVALVLTMVGTPAYAGTTWMVPDGEIKGTLIQDLVFNFVGTTTCTSMSLSGHVEHDGDPLVVDPAASVGGCSGTASSVDLLDLPWNGRAVYAPLPYPSQEDGTIALDAVAIRLTILGIHCTYGGDITAKAYNWTSPGLNTLLVSLADITLGKTSGTFLCPSVLTTTKGVLRLTTASGGLLRLTGTYP